MSINGDNGNGQYNESENEEVEIDGYIPDPNYEPDGNETEFIFDTDTDVTIPPELEGVIGSGAIRNIRSVGSTRTSIQITMSSKLRDQWYNFVEVLTGNKISPGRTSASAPLVTMSMRLLMALVAEFEVEDSVKDLRELLGVGGSAKLNTMLKKLLERA